MFTLWGHNFRVGCFMYHSLHFVDKCYLKINLQVFFLYDVKSHRLSNAYIATLFFHNVYLQNVFELLKKGLKIKQARAKLQSLPRNKLRYLRALLHLRLRI